MNISECSFEELSYPILFNTYLSQYRNLELFFEHNPLDEQKILENGTATASGFFKNEYLLALQEYHKQLGIEESQQNQRQKLAQDNALVVVTGQQLGVLGGPMYTVYKTITAIIAARNFEKKTGRPVVPVFWLADEDHDFEEISWAGITTHSDFKKVHLSETGTGKPVAEELITDDIEQFKNQVKELLPDTDFSENLWQQIDALYKSGNSHVQAFAGLINEWFADEGLLIAGSNFKSVKQLLAPAFAKSIMDEGAVFEAIEKQSAALEKDFHRQVANGDSNLFYLTEKRKRVKIHKENNMWSAEEKKWTKEELVENINQNPEQFSPNVFLRPIIQDQLLPTLGYVAGPGEVSYYAQMKKLYEEFELNMPVIFPRICGTLVESGISRIIEKLPFKLSEYEKRMEDLEAEFIEKSDTIDIEPVFSAWKEKLEAAAENPLQVIQEIDPTLEGTVGKTVAGFENELDRLKGRVYRSIKQQEKVQINRIEKIKVNLFPDGGLQERAVSPIYFMNKYGLDIWSKLLAQIEKEGMDLSCHHIIEI